MKSYATTEIRNVVLLGSSDAGKTLLAEAMLFEGGVVARKGTIEGKNTVSDSSELEQQNGKSIFSSVLYTEFMDHKLNLFDTPGSDDFIGATVPMLTVADLAVMVVNAQRGAEVGTEIFTRWAVRMHKPMIVALNQLDHEKANYEHALESLELIYGPGLVTVQYPVNAGAGFDSFIDVLLMKMYRFTGDQGQREELEIPADQLEKAKALNVKLIEKAAENDDHLMELYFEKGLLTEDEIRKGLSIGLAHGEVYPVFCLSALKSIGIKRLMEFIIRVGASPDQVAPLATPDGEAVPCTSEGRTALFVFKTANEPHIGEINYFKVARGVLKENQDLINVDTAVKERLSQIFVVAGGRRERVGQLAAGDVGAVVKLKGTKSDQTLCEEDAQVKIAPMVFPNHKYRVAVKASNQAETEKLGELLHRAQEEDLSLGVEFSKELRQIIVSGQGEHHLDILKWRLINEGKLQVEFLPPRIPYRETITKMAQGGYRHKKQSGGAGQFAEVHLVVEPYTEGMADPTKYKVDGRDLNLNVRDKNVVELEWGGKLVFYNCIVGGVIDNRFMPAILKGVMEKMERGPLTGSYARDICVSVYDGKMHPVDSNEISFKLAGRNAFSMAFKEAGPKIMEPIYEVEVLVPSDRMGDVMSDLQNRRAIILGMENAKGFEKIKAHVPLAEMGKYSTALSSLTSGRATFDMAFVRYEAVPSDIQQRLLKEYEESAESQE